ncbi:aminopeptidase N [Pseudoalteromonas sp. SSM20]|uniref:aminopeptidase N n=1 Tax=Pseudoalteromonas sp. SSM20 TaxID=3139394 RepID=UPI003BAAA4E2
MSDQHISTNQAKYRKDYKAPEFLVDSLYLEFDLQPTQTRVLQKSQYKRVGSSQSELWLDGVNQTLHCINVNGDVFTEYETFEQGILLKNLPAEFELHIETEIDPKNNTSLEGLYLSDGAYCTQCEAEGFRKITYFQDRPDVLTKYTVKVIADKSFTHLLSNGNKIDSGELADGRHFNVWQDPYNKPSYLFALVAGDFDVLQDKFTTRSGRDVLLELFVDKGNLSKADHAMASLKRAMKWDEERFNLEYDLDIYMIVAVDFFNMGAMENKGLNIFNSKCVLANQATATDRDYHTIESIVGHEYFHNWTGNRVTCQDWFQLSLKEGLTVFRDQEFSSDIGSRALNRIDAVKVMRGPQFSEDAGPMAHPIRPDKVIEMNNFYTVTVYDKGSEVIRMMHTLLGETNFQKGMQLYFERHDGTAATCDDFVSAMQDASNIDLSLFSKWYSQSGTPELTVIREYNESDRSLTLTVSQKTAPTQDQNEKQALHIPLAIELISPEGVSQPLQINGELIGNVVSLKQETQQFIFENIDADSSVVFLEDFSAPCKVVFEQSLNELILIVKHARSDFSKWDAMQRLMIVCLKETIDKGEELPKAIIDLFEYLLASEVSDLSLLSELITLPSFDSIAATYDTIPVDEICAQLASVKSTLANLLKDSLVERYNGLSETGGLDAHSVGVRTLKGCLLGYLTLTDWQLLSSELESEFENTNMTNSLNALNAVCDSLHASHSNFLARFKEKWQHDVLVLDKWLAQIGRLKTEHVTNTISQMFDSGEVDITNPNRVRALLMSYCMFNPQAFHAIDGSGYKLLTDLLIKLDKINPQNAARLITPLLSFKRHTIERQNNAKQQLQRLAAIADLSPDLFEKVSNALNGE